MLQTDGWMDDLIWQLHSKTTLNLYKQWKKIILPFALQEQFLSLPKHIHLIHRTAPRHHMFDTTTEQYITLHQQSGSRLWVKRQDISTTAMTKASHNNSLLTGINWTGWRRSSRLSTSLLYLCITVCMVWHHHTSPMINDLQPVSTLDTMTAVISSHRFTWHSANLSLQCNRIGWWAVSWAANRSRSANIYRLSVSVALGMSDKTFNTSYTTVSVEW